jgi:molybdopterin converting factor small subunit
VVPADIVRVRLFAAARAAAGVDELDLPAHSPSTIAEVLEQVIARAPADSAGRLAEVIGRCSFLLNTVAETDDAAPVSAGDVLDVLPPFAGG